MARALAPAPSDALTALARRARSLADVGPAWWSKRRADALARLEARGLPTTSDEDWKYTSVAPIARTPWGHAKPAAAGASADVRKAIDGLALRLHGGIAVVLVDGRLAPGLSTLPTNVVGLTVSSLADALRRAPASLEPILGAVAAPDRPFTDLSTSLAENGLVVHLARGTCLPVPVEVIHVTTQAGVAVFPRTLVVAEPSSRLTLVEHHVSTVPAGESGRPGAYLTVPVVEVAVARNAAVEHVLWQDDADTAFHVATVAVRQDGDSRFASHVLTLGAALARTDVDVALLGEGAECTLDGLYLVFDDRHADHHTRIDHAVPHGTSRELYKGILDGKATGVFNGRVLVRPGAQKTDSQQTNHNLLLSPDATVDTKPELEIYADDVKCAHGATVGRLDADRLFYLRSRGLAERDARDLLLRAFARDVTERISIEAVRARLDDWMTANLPALAGREESL